MQATSRFTESSYPSNAFGLSPSAIAFIDDKLHVLHRFKSALARAGFKNVRCLSPDEDASRHINNYEVDLVFIDVISSAASGRGFELLSRIRQRGFRGSVAMISARPTADLCYRAARLGASDFLVRSPGLDIAKETARLLARRQLITGASWRPEAVLATGIFSSIGMTEAEMTILAAFADGFPRHQVLAERLDRSEKYIRKVFSRVYKKLGCHLDVTNAAQLSHFLTVCSLYN
jgi:DNA-binding NarL/FixJ family response regulator